MMDLRKTVHNLWSLLDPQQGCRIRMPRRGRHIPSAPSSAGLRCVSGEIPRSTPHVVESAAVGSKPHRLPLPLPPMAEGGGVEEASLSGCLYGRSGGACLDLCTESLGFESCCDGRVGAEERQAEQEIRRRIEEYKRRPSSEREMNDDDDDDDDELQRRKGRSRRRKTQAKVFPPPLPSLGVGGHSSSFLKAVKSDGRLVLTEVRVERPEILRASRRRDGRLTLELVRSEQADQVEEKESAEKGGALAQVLVEAAKTEEKDEGAEEERRRWEAPGVLEERRGEGRELGCQEMVRSSLPPSPLWGARFVTTA